MGSVSGQLTPVDKDWNAMQLGWIAIPNKHFYSHPL